MTTVYILPPPKRETTDTPPHRHTADNTGTHTTHMPTCPHTHSLTTRNVGLSVENVTRSIRASPSAKPSAPSPRPPRRRPRRPDLPCEPAPAPRPATRAYLCKPACPSTRNTSDTKSATGNSSQRMVTSPTGSWRQTGRCSPPAIGSPRSTRSTGATRTQTKSDPDCGMRSRTFTPQRSPPTGSNPGSRLHTGGATHPTGGFHARTHPSGPENSPDGRDEYDPSPAPAPTPDMDTATAPAKSAHDDCTASTALSAMARASSRASSASSSAATSAFSRARARRLAASTRRRPPEPKAKASTSTQVPDTPFPATPVAASTVDDPETACLPFEPKSAV